MSETARLERQPYRRHYSSAEYRRNRVVAYRRDHGSCRGCGVDVHVGVDHCDHIVPLADGGTDDLGNLMWLCVRCHKEKTKDDRRRRAGRRSA